MSTADFVYRYEAGAADADRVILLLHGTGGTEDDLLSLGRALDPAAHLLSPRGKVLENGAPRFFRRFAEGVLDVENWRVRSGELAAFVSKKVREHVGASARVTAVGYSNGANIALGLLLLHPEVVAAAVLLRPMFVTDDLPELRAEGRRALILAGEQDPLMHPDDPERLKRQLTERGVAVTLKTLPSGHGLIRDDFEAARKWLEASGKTE